MTDAAADTTTRTHLKMPSMWKVLLHNDDFTPMDFVVEVLIQVFSKERSDAAALMMAVHEKGKAIVGLYTKEVASSKANLALTAAVAHGHPLLCTVEEA
jgi:ATP-dependent Clp protease adaptor protein ClpS